MNSEVWCGACKGIGYTTVRNGDDDIECEVCHGSGDAQPEQPTVSYYLLHTASRFRLPFPFATRAEAERHMQCLMSVYEIVEVEDVTREADEEGDEMAIRERAARLEVETWGVSSQLPHS